MQDNKTISHNGVCTVYTPGTGIELWTGKQAHTLRVRELRKEFVITYIIEGHRKKTEVRVPKDGAARLVVVDGRCKQHYQRYHGKPVDGFVATTHGRYGFVDARWSRDVF